MTAIRKIKKWLDTSRVSGIALIAAIIFLSSVVSDQVLHWRGIRGSETYINDLFLAAMAGLLAGLWMARQARQHELRRAHERMAIAAELNQQVRSAVVALANSTMIRDEAERLQVMDEAMDRIDRVLTELIPARPGERQARQ
ncbi:MAG: hypothetical protein ACRD5R_14665 [Candidatus Acidiferrales bacterium]